ncbi:hypothetical protein [Parachlamydia sp. AcF125]|uniref:hypothetical protein n=1 Tax=Parachlamydia sp. AcF125 TaxID=2795736 RepID=UPI001BC8F5F3|nr:hypothetical protein [Parachlamydia sp. AcF125]MBS4168223.1 hypothetical protein [Parachlamydia sp. AcF125]
MLLTFQPFLQPSFTRQLLLEVIERQELVKKESQASFFEAIRVKAALGAIILLGSGKALSACVAVVAFKILGAFSEEIREKGQQETSFLKGVVVAVLISVYALTGTSRAHSLIIRIEQAADRQFEEISSKGIDKFEEAIDRARKRKVKEYLVRKGNPTAFFPSTWDDQASHAKEAFARFIQNLKQTYPSQPSEGKYAILKEARETIKAFIRSIDRFSLAEEEIKPSFPFDQWN